MNITNLTLVLLAGIASGFANTVGGGGSLVSLPALIFLGMPSATANGTNRIALMVQNIVAVSYFRHKGYFYPKMSFLLGIPAVLGSILGAKLAVNLPDETFNKVLAAVMLIVLVLILWRPEKYFIKEEQEDENYGTMRSVLAAIAFFGVGFYGGFIQAGVGFIIIVALTLITGMPLVKINSLKVLIVAIYMFSSLLVFIFSGKVDWDMGAVLAAGNAIGAYAGSALSVSKGDGFIRAFLIVAILIMSAKLLGLHKLLIN